jgi:hypothetical protein
MMQEFMMFSLGVPLSRKSLAKYISIATTRMKLILQVLIPKSYPILYLRKLLSSVVNQRLDLLTWRNNLLPGS